jgi:phosphomannomutase
VLARDGRLGGELVRDVVASTFAASGCVVFDLGVATTPTAGVMVDHHSADGAVIITASHNPQQWNGIKALTARGCAPPADEALRINALFEQHAGAFAPVDRLGYIAHDDTGAHVHVARVLDAIAPIATPDAIRARGFTVVADSVNASGVRTTKLLMDALGCTLIHLNDDTTPATGGRFPHAPEPTADNLEGLAWAVRDAKRADVGFAQDPDADRLAIIDETGAYIGEEYTLALGARAVLEAMPDNANRGPLAANLSTSRMLDDVAQRFGVEVVRTPVGEAHLAEAMQREGSPVGGEGNGGVIWPPITLVRDSVSAMALTLALMTRTKKTVSALVGDLPRYAIVKRKTPIRPGLAQRAAAAVRADLGELDGARVNDADGVRVDLDAAALERLIDAQAGGPAWVHVRASNTEPIFRLIAEAPTEAAANALLDRVAGIIDAAR